MQFQILDCRFSIATKTEARSAIILKCASGPPVGRTRPAANSDLRLGVPGEVVLNAFRQKPLATALASTRERGATAFSSHAGAKTMLAFASSLGWLVSSFHKAKK